MARFRWATAVVAVATMMVVAVVDVVAAVPFHHVTTAGAVAGAAVATPCAA